jgi:hypothetical protein
MAETMLAMQGLWIPPSPTGAPAQPFCLDEWADS